LTTSIIRFINIILAALLAGVSFGLWIGFNPSLLSSAAYIEQQQNILRSLSVLMTTLVFTATLITIISAFRQRKDKDVFITLLIAAACFIGCIIISAFGIKPIDNYIMTWTPGAPPADWIVFRDKWRSLHIMRTVSELMALLLVTWTGISK
jgi:amino acid permease